MLLSAFSNAFLYLCISPYFHAMRERNTFNSSLYFRCFVCIDIDFICGFWASLFFLRFIGLHFVSY